MKAVVLSSLSYTNKSNSQSSSQLSAALRSVDAGYDETDSLLGTDDKRRIG
jgi:hypothetical protein